MARIYDQLWDAEPPRRTVAERTAADRQRELAGRYGWPPPMAYDDDTIDQPDGDPPPGWKRVSRTTLRSVDLAEDARWVREHGGYRQAAATELAVRLGVSRGALAKALKQQTRDSEQREAG